MAEPTLRHFSMPGGSRMDPVPNPIGRTGLPADKFFKQGVEGNQPGTRFFCQFTDKDGQIGQFVAAESAVVELIARTRVPRFVPRGHERHVRVPINMVQVCPAPFGRGFFIVIHTTPVAIGDAVSDKNHTWPVLSLLIPGKGVGAARATRHQKSP